jgi:ketosteroid isomerase-like protein
MPDHELVNIIASADAAINAEDFDALMTFYAEDATLVVEPGRWVTGQLAKTRVRGTLKNGEPYNVLRSATYVFRKEQDGASRCTIDNPYGVNLLSTKT